MHFWERKNEIQDSDEKVRDAGFSRKRSGNAGSGPPLPDPVPHCESYLLDLSAYIGTLKDISVIFSKFVRMLVCSHGAVSFISLAFLRALGLS